MRAGTFKGKVVNPSWGLVRGGTNPGGRWLTVGERARSGHRRTGQDSLESNGSVAIDFVKCCCPCGRITPAGSSFGAYWLRRAAGVAGPEHVIPSIELVVARCQERSCGGESRVAESAPQKSHGAYRSHIRT